MKRIKCLVSGVFLLLLGGLTAQEVSGKKIYPLGKYEELANPQKSVFSDWNNEKSIVVGWGSTDIRYEKELPAKDLVRNTLRLTAWKGERVSAQFVISNNDKEREITYEFNEMGKIRVLKNMIPTEAIFSGFVRYVMTDELNKDGKGACGHRKPEDFIQVLVADPIDHLLDTLQMPPQTTQGVWVSVAVPEHIKKGIYQRRILVKDKKRVVHILTLEVEVIDRTLPRAKDGIFHLDLWQNPFAVARYYDVKPWSEAHFEALKKEMQLYADAGGDVITASIMHKPWNGQTEDYFETMVTWMKKADGTWSFDYTIFDQWVEFMLSLGVDKQINAYSMIPWHLSFQYFDQATNSLQFIDTKPGEEAYEQLWTAMLTSFAKHLKEKGWFEKTFIAMDERPMEAMQQAISVIRKADPNFKISLAGALHKELVDELDDYCVSINYKFEKEDLKKRKGEGKVTTYYTSCAEPRPNTFTFSPPAESEWLGWYAYSAGFDGYLRWAFNSWVQQPLQDSRFRTWGAGDTYFVYPNGRSSIRFERLVAGIQAFEKVDILKKMFELEDNKEALEELHSILKLFNSETLLEISATDVVREANERLRVLSRIK